MWTVLCNKLFFFFLKKRCKACKCVLKKKKIATRVIDPTRLDKLVLFKIDDKKKIGNDNKWTK